MKYNLPLIVLLLAIASGSLNCGAYFGNRGRDLGDVLTVSGGTGYSFGIKARVGPVQGGLYSSVERRRVGLRGGQFVYDRVHDLADSLNDGEGDQWFFWGSDGFEPNNYEPAIARGKAYRAQSLWFYTPILQFPRGVEKFPLYYFTQLDASIGFGWWHLRLGCNPGELLDFCSGLFCLDIMRDDLHPPSNTDPPQSEAAAAQPAEVTP